MIVALAGPAGAQTDVRPGVARQGDLQTGQDLNLTLDLTEAYDQDVAAKVGNIPISLFQGSGLYTMATPHLDFDTNSGRVKLLVALGSSERYYPDLHQIIVASSSAGVGFSVQLTPQTSVSLDQSVGYSTALFNGMFAGVAPVPGETALPASNNALTGNRSVAYATTAGFTHTISRRTAVLVHAGYRYDDFIGEQIGYADVRSQDVGGQFTYAVSRDLKLRLGYTFRKGQYIGSPITTEHNMDIGVDYTRPISKTRKTTIALSLGPSFANGSLPSDPTLEIKRQFRAIGEATLTHRIGRTWSLKGNYRRGLGYIEGFQTPLYTVAYSASAGGFLSRRTDLTLSAAYSTGESALVGATDQFTTYSGDLRFRRVLNATWATYAEYLFYYYQFGPGVVVPPGVPPGLTRNGVRVGLTMQMPVMRHK